MTVAPFDAVLDSKMSFSVIPAFLYNALRDVQDGTTTVKDELLFPCENISRLQSVFLNIEGHRFRIPLEGLYRPGLYEGVCIGNFKYPTYGYRLGAAFIDPLYLIVNLDDSELSIGQANYTTEENIEEFQRFIPGAIRADSLPGPGGKSSSKEYYLTLIVVCILSLYLLLAYFIVK